MSTQEDIAGVVAALASRLGITGGTLRLRAHRIRQTLEKCVVECRREQAAGTV